MLEGLIETMELQDAQDFIWAEENYEDLAPQSAQLDVGGTGSGPTMTTRRILVSRTGDRGIYEYRAVPASSPTSPQQLPGSESDWVRYQKSQEDFWTNVFTDPLENIQKADQAIRREWQGFVDSLEAGDWEGTLTFLGWAGLGLAYGWAAIQAYNALGGGILGTIGLVGMDIAVGYEMVTTQGVTENVAFGLGALAGTSVSQYGLTKGAVDFASKVKEIADALIPSWQDLENIVEVIMWTVESVPATWNLYMTPTRQFIKGLEGAQSILTDPAIYDYVF